MKKQTIIQIAFLVLLSLVSVFAVHADTGGYGQYGPYQGPGPSTKIMIDKFVGRPKTTTSETKGGQKTSSTSYDYVENLASSDYKFSAGQEVMFMLKVKNTSDKKITSVKVSDILPAYIEPVEGPGDYKSDTRTISFNAGDFNAGEEKTYYVKVKVVGQNNLPVDQSIVCMVNKATASVSDAIDDDTSQFCVEKSVPPTKEVPKSGPEFGLLLLSGEIIALGAGLLLKKKIS